MACMMMGALTTAPSPVLGVFSKNYGTETLQEPFGFRSFHQFSVKANRRDSLSFSELQFLSDCRCFLNVSPCPSDSTSTAS